MNDNKSILYSGWLKAAGVVLLCIFGACAVYFGSAAILKEGYFSGETADTYAGTRSCYERLKLKAVDTVESSVIDGEKEYLYYTNIAAEITDLSDDTTVFKSTEEDCQREEIFYVAVREEPYETAVYAVETPDDAPSDTKVYEVKIGLLEGYPYADDFREMSNLYAFASHAGSFGFFPAAISILLFLAVLIYEFTAAGHVRGKPGITLGLLDGIPYDLVSFLYLILDFSLFAILVSMLPQYGSFVYQISWLIMIMMVLSLGIYGWLMTTARRVKAGGWYRNTLCWKFGTWIRRVLRMIPAVPMASFAAFVWLIIQWGICDSAGYYSGIAGWMALAAPVLAAGFVYCVWACRRLREASRRLAAGELDYAFSEQDRKMMIGPFRRWAEYQEQVAEGMQKAIDQQMKSERLKAELITNVSHDIKTPLTSIINYVDLLQKEHTDEQEKEYITVLERQSQRLKKLTEDVVEASKASTGNISVHREKTSVKEILDQAYAEYEEKLTAAGLTVITNVRDTPLYADTDGRLLWRILRNLLSNCAKYALEGTRVYIDAAQEGEERIEITVKNTSADPLNISSEELMERFVRGDSSRHTEGSGLGLNIAKSLTELLDGSFEVIIDGDLFKARIRLPRG